MTKKLLCYYCEITDLESYTAEELSTSTLEKNILTKLANPFQYFLGKPVCNSCKEKIIIKIKELIKR